MLGQAPNRDANIRIANIREANRRTTKLVLVGQTHLQLVHAGRNAVEQFTGILQVGRIRGGIEPIDVAAANANVIRARFACRSRQDHAKTGVTRVRRPLILGETGLSRGVVKRILQDAGIHGHAILFEQGNHVLRFRIRVLRLGNDIAVGIDQFHHRIKAVGRAVDIQPDFRTTHAAETVDVDIFGIVDHTVDLEAQTEILVARLLTRGE